MKVSEVVSILGRLDQNGEIGIERSRQSEIPAVIEVELYELGIKKHVLPGVGETYLLYPTTKAASSTPDHAIAASQPSTLSRRRGVMEGRPLVPVAPDEPNGG